MLWIRHRFTARTVPPDAVLHVRPADRRLCETRPGAPVAPPFQRWPVPQAPQWATSVRADTRVRTSRRTPPARQQKFWWRHSLVCAAQFRRLIAQDFVASDGTFELQALNVLDYDFDNSLWPFSGSYTARARPRPAARFRRLQMELPHAIIQRVPANAHNACRLAPIPNRPFQCAQQHGLFRLLDPHAVERCGDCLGLRRAVLEAQTRRRT
jgi:hypothetical protein